MAGTSADGIDAACVRINGKGASMKVQHVRHFHKPFAAALRRRLLNIMAPAQTTTEELARLHADLGNAFAAAAADAIRQLPQTQRPTLIGSAGQTVCHLPGSRVRQTVTLQIGEPARIAAATGITTVADFRQADVAVGGQGAPLVPWTDWVLFRHPRRSRIVLNIGGIANITWLPAGGSEEQIQAFDTGPGNMIIDGLVSHVTRGRSHMDRDGRRAARGTVLASVLETWLRHPYFKRKPPKSTGRETFGDNFIKTALPQLRRASRSADDWIATATLFTARTVARACRTCLPTNPPQRLKTYKTNGSSKSSATCELIVCGGGAMNPTLLAMLASELPGVTVTSIHAYDIPTQAKECVSFAMLAAARIDGVSACLPQVTGAKEKPLLGGLFSASL